MITLPIVSKAVCVRAFKGLALLRASHSSKIARAGSRLLRSTREAAPVLFGHAIVTEIIIGRITSPSGNPVHERQVLQLLYMQAMLSH